MRHLVYLLLVANLVYLGWNVFASSSAPEQVRQLPPLPALDSPLVTLQEREAETDADTDSVDEVSSLETLTVEQPLPALESPSVTLQEREAESNTNTDSADEVSSIEAFTVEQPLPVLESPLVILQEREADADTDSVDEAPSIEEFAVEQPLSALESPLVTLQEREVATDADSADEVSSIETFAVEQPLSALESPLVTLPEREVETNTDTDSADEVSRIGALTVQQPPGAGAAILCQALGPFLVVSDMEVVESRLIDLGLQPTQRELESKELNGYWVYLSAMPREDVQTVLAILEEHKDKEYYVGKQNFISLGTFKGIARAERRLKETRKMGLDATLEKRFTSQNSWWLDIQSDGAAPEQMNRIVASRPELQLVEIACY
jgi:hypothetical protein